MSDETVTDDTGIRVVDAVFDDVAGHLNAQHGRLVANAVWMLDHVDQWQGDGLWKPEQYVALRAGVSGATAKKAVDVARRANEFPECVAALQAGVLSLDQLAPIVRHAPGWCDRQMAGLAPRCTVAQISKIARKYPWDLDLTTKTNESNADSDTDEDVSGEVGSAHTSDEAVAPTPADSCWWGYDDDGRFRLHLETDQERGSVIEAALCEARDSLFESGQRAPSGVDAVSEMAARSVGAVESPSRRNRYRVNIHIAVDGTATDARGVHLPAPIARHVSCDGIVAPVFVEAGLPVSVGRSQHIVPDRTRRIVEHRDGGCRVPGCTSSRFVEVHHIVHWSDHGPTDTWNLICLCPAHHRLHHRGRLKIAGNADVVDGVVFTDVNGKNLLERCSRPKPPGAPPSPINGTYQHPLGERLEFRWLYFNDDPTRPNRIPPH